jgi:hypothetical protein
MATMKSLLKIFGGGYRYRSDEMLRFFLSDLLHQWGLPVWYATPADAKDQIQEAIGLYSRHVEENPPFHDLLGPIYMELSSQGGRQALGQFFTPWPVAKMMSPEAQSEDGELLTACDPASGSGVMMLAQASTVLDYHGAEALKNWSLFCCDLDPFCARMSAVQLVGNCSVHGVQIGEIVVLRGDSLSTREEKEIIVHASAPGVSVHPAKHPNRLEALSSAYRQQQVGNQAPIFVEESITA